MSSTTRDVQCGRTDMMKLIVVFRSFKNASKEGFIVRKYITHQIKVINSVKVEIILL